MVGGGRQPSRKRMRGGKRLHGSGLVLLEGERGGESKRLARADLRAWMWDTGRSNRRWGC